MTRRRCNRCGPRYVSTIDSGNLAGHLLTLRAGLLLLVDELPQLTRLLDGLRDTLRPSRRRPARRRVQ